MRRAWRVRCEVATDAVYVVFTSIEETVLAVRVASPLAAALRSRLIVVHFRPIAFGAPLDHPTGVSPLETEEFRARLEAEDCEADVRVCVCRDVHAALSTVFKEHSLVVLGNQRRWWRTTANRWRRTLEAAGHLVVLVDEEAHA
jgi:hypothetical protein